MAATFFTVAVPVTATNLDALINALTGHPTVQSLGTTTAGVNKRAAVVRLQGAPANAGPILFGGPGLTASIACGGSIAAGLSASLGEGSDAILDISQIYVLATAGAGADLLYVAVLD